MPKQRPALDRRLARERVTFEVAGSEYGEKWKGYRVECQAIVVWTFESEADCLRHSADSLESTYPAVGAPNANDYDEDITTANAESDHSPGHSFDPPMCPNPNNRRQLIKPIRWRVYHQSSPWAFAERVNNAPPRIVGHTRTAVEAERIRRGLALIGCLPAERRRKQKAFKDGEELEAKIVEVFTKACIDGTRAGREVHYTQELIAEKLGYSARYIFGKLFPLFELDPAKVEQKANKNATATQAAVFG